MRRLRINGARFMENGPQTTIRALLGWARALLVGEDARTDSEVLLACVLRCSRTFLYAHDNDVVLSAEAGRYQELILRRRETHMRNVVDLDDRHRISSPSRY